VKNTRDWDRSEERSLGRGRRTLIGFALTVLLLAAQGQLVAGATSPEDESSTPAASAEVAPAEEAPAEEAPAEEPPAEEAPAEEAPAEEAPDTGGESAGDAEGADDGGSAAVDEETNSGEADAPAITRSRRSGTGPLRPQWEGPDVLVTKSASVREADGGDGFTYTITVWNQSEDAASSVTVTDDLPDNLTVDSVTPSQGTCSVGDGNVVFCHIGSIPGAPDPGTPHPFATITISVTVPEDFCGSLINQAHVAAQNEPSQYRGNNDSELVKVDVPCRIDLAIEKSANLDGNPLPGESFSYTITVTNLGTGPAEGALITDTFPDGVAVDESQLPEGCILDGNTVTCVLGEIAPGDSLSVTIVVTIDEDFCGQLENSAEVGGIAGEPGHDDESETVIVEVECQPDVAIEKRANLEGNPLPGDTFTYTITVTNMGTGTAEDVVVTDVIQAGMALDDWPDNCTVQPGEDEETITCELGDIPQGEFRSVSITVAIDEDFCGELTNTATVTASNDTNPENDESETVKVEVECRPDVSVDKSASVEEVGSGGSFTYTITVTNEGTGTAEGVTLDDDLNDNLSVSVTASQGECSIGTGNLLTCDLGDIDQGGSATVTITVQIPEDFCGELLNQANVEAENEDESDTENNKSELISVDVPCGPDIDVVKTNDADEDGSFNDQEEALHEGDSVTFQVVITNTGNVAIVLDTLLDEFEAIAISPACLTAEGESVIGMTLDPGDSVTCYFTVDDYAPEPNGEIVDVVTVGGHQFDNPQAAVSDFDDSTVTTPQVLPQPPVRPRPPVAPPGEVLAVTGADLARLGLMALALLLAGAILSRLGRKEDEPGK
jgi:uncharacterized repeat protein (TIGR01451 family)